VTLVPYRKEHVEIYHKWMEDEWIREMTASERLTLEQEYAMQESWHLDPDKCTFIILDRSLPDTPNIETKGGAMAGDVNLFLNQEKGSGEIEVMIAQEKRVGT